LGILLFQESVNVVCLASIGLVVVGIAGLKLSSDIAIVPLSQYFGICR